MTRQLLVVFGGTGAQGGSVITQVLSDPDLSKQFSIRAITRDPSKPKAQSLSASGVEVIQADLDDVASINAACTGAHTVFGNTVSDYGRPVEHEYNQGKAIADAAVTAGATWLIWSTTPVTKDVSGGKYTKVVHFDVKGYVEAYARTLPIRTAFFSPGTFMSNFVTFTKPRPSPMGDGTYVFSGPQTPETKFPLLNTEGDTGKWVAAILADPEKYEGKSIFGATALVSQIEMAEVFSRVTGKKVKYVQVDTQTFQEHIPHGGEEVLEMMLYFQDFGYWGKGTEEGLKWSAAQARGRLTTLEEYISNVNPITLD